MMFLQPVSRFLSWHFYVLFQYLDPIVSDSSKPVKSNIPKWDPSFVFPVIFMLFTLINCNVILPVYEYDVSLTLTDLLSSSALFFRQMFPEEMRPLTDVALVIGVSASFAIYISFWNNPWTLNRFCGETLGKRRSILRFGQSKQREESSRKIQKYHKRIKAVSFNSITFIVIFSSIFFYINLYLTSIYHVSINLLFICFVIIPINTWYVFYALFGFVTFTILGNYFFTIRQKVILSQLNGINKQLKHQIVKKTDKKSIRLQKISKLKNQNLLLNRQAVTFCMDIESYATYWSSSLTLFFLDHITLQCYLLYVIFFIDTLPFLQKILFIYVVMEINVLLFCLINFCAILVKLNRAIELANHDFYLIAFVGKGLPKQAKGSIRYQLKAESLQTNHRLRPYAFHFSDNYRITSKTFYMVLSNISLFFLLVFKRTNYI